MTRMLHVKMLMALRLVFVSMVTWAMALTAQVRTTPHFTLNVSFSWSFSFIAISVIFSLCDD